MSMFAEERNKISMEESKQLEEIRLEKLAEREPYKYNVNRKKLTKEDY